MRHHKRFCWDCRLGVDPHLFPRQNFICSGCQGSKFRRILLPKRWRLTRYPEEVYKRTSCRKNLIKDEIYAIYSRYDPFICKVHHFKVTIGECYYCFTNSLWQAEDVISEEESSSSDSTSVTTSWEAKETERHQDAGSVGSQ